MTDYIQELPLNDPQTANLLTEVIEKIVENKLKNLGFNKKYPAVVTAVGSGVATIKLMNGDTEISNVKVRNGVLINVGDEVYVEAINGSLNNIYIDFNKSMATDAPSSTHNHDDRYYTEAEIDSMLGSFGNMKTAVYDTNEDGIVNNSDKLDGYDANTGTVALTIPVRDGSGKIPGDITGNAATATKLQTAKTISLSGDATGSTSFDGSTNVSITATLANSGVTAGTYTKVTVDSKGRVTSGSNITSADVTDATFANTANMLVKRDASGNFSAGTITATLNGNASTASKLQTARTITLSGDIAGSTSFDGSNNITIATNLANSGVTAGTYPKVTVDAKGRVISGATLSASDIPSHTHNTSSITGLATVATTGDYNDLINKPAVGSTDYGNYRIEYDSVNDRLKFIYLL